MPPAICTYVPTAKDKPVPGVAVTIITLYLVSVLLLLLLYVLFHIMPTAGSSDSLKDKRDISRQSQR
jgi:predicted membrane channel-forming protein YqfA (hemolysin III family)